MNIEITRHQADQLRAILSDALASAERLAIHPDASDVLVKRSETIADVCLSIINKIKHEQFMQSVNKAQAILRERVTNERTGLDR